MASLIKSTSQAIFVFWLMIMPFITFNNSYEGPKVFVFWIGSFLLVLYWLLFRRHEFKSVINKWDYWYWLWILTLVISSIFGIDPVKSIIGGGYRHQGVIFFISLWLTGKTYFLLDENYKKLFSKYFVVAVIAQSILVIIQKLLSLDLVNGRPIGTLGEANAVAGLVNLGLFFSQNIYFVGLVFIANLILQSRSGLLMFLIILFPIFFKRRYVVAVAFVTTILLVLGLTLLRPKSNDFRFEDRGLNNKLSISAIYKSPVIGYGLESTDVVFEKEFKNIDINLEDLMIDRSHNLFLDILIWSGLLGLVPFCIWLLGNTYESYIKNDLKKTFAILAILTLGMLQPIWLAHWVLLFLILNR